MAKGRTKNEEYKKPKFFVTNGNCDYQVLFLTITLVLFGIMMVYSSSSYRAIINGLSADYLAKKQGMFAILGLVAMMVVSAINYRYYQYFAKLLMAVSIALGIVVLILGRASGGAVRWIPLGPVNLQPSEVAKPIIMIYIAHMASEYPKMLRSIPGMLKIAAWPMVNALLIMTENLSTAIICVVIIFSMIFVASPNWKDFFKLKYLAIYVVVIAVALFFAFYKKEYRLIRIKAWLHPELYPKDTYQTLQSLYAIGSGGLFGRGLGQSIQKTGNLPESHNDMIFAIICEELGLFGGLVLLAVFLMLILRLMSIIRNTPDVFGGLVMVGIMVHISFQLLVNVGVVTNTIPNTGVTLPFVSYGGTSLLFLMIEMGMVLSISRQQRFE